MNGTLNFGGDEDNGDFLLNDKNNALKFKRGNDILELKPINNTANSPTTDDSTNSSPGNLQEANRTELRYQNQDLENEDSTINEYSNNSMKMRKINDFMSEENIINSSKIFAPNYYQNHSHQGNGPAIYFKTAPNMPQMFDNNFGNSRIDDGGKRSSGGGARQERYKRKNLRLKEKQSKQIIKVENDPNYIGDKYDVEELVGMIEGIGITSSTVVNGSQKSKKGSKRLKNTTTSKYKLELESPNKEKEDSVEASGNSYEQDELDVDVELDISPHEASLNNHSVIVIHNPFRDIPDVKRLTMKEKEAIWNKSLPGVQKDGLLISSNFNARKALESLKKQWKEIPKEDETLPLNSE